MYKILYKLNEINIMEILINYMGSINHGNKIIKYIKILFLVFKFLFIDVKNNRVICAPTETINEGRDIIYQMNRTFKTLFLS
ncbi:MAG: hypothetical protein GX288_03805 [Clostridiales bacterium]|nr:hypothetical protein [Clostridiales bacterium]